MRRWWIEPGITLRVKAMANPPAIAALLLLPLAACPQERQNYLGDLFVQLTSGLVHCPVPEGCVQSEAQSQALEAAVRNMDDVESVINLLMVGAEGAPRYKVAALYKNSQNLLIYL